MMRYISRLFSAILVFTLVVSMLAVAQPSHAAPTDPLINEFVANHTGADTQAFVEVFGDPSTDYSGFTVLEIEGDGAGAGLIDAVLPVGTTNAGGYWIDPEDMENGTLTILLVENFTGTPFADLDADNDGVLDSTPWARLVDDVAVTDGGSTDLTYSGTVLAPGFGGSPFTPGGASRIPNGTDTDTSADWALNDFDGFGLPGFPGTPDPGEAVNTPDAENELIPVIPESAPTINEIRIDQPGADNDEYFELAGTSGSSLDGLTYLVIGDGVGGSGVIEAVVDLTGSSIPAGGFFVAAEATFTIGTADLTTSLNFENSDNVTHLLVRGFTGSDAQDLDTDDDGVLDSMPWTSILDSVALVETPGSGDLIYSTTVVGPDGLFVPGHVYLCPAGWLIGSFGIPGADTPGAANDCTPVVTIEKIHNVQGSGLTSPLVGNTVVIEGIVVGDFQDGASGTNGDLNGFFVQEEDADADADPSTSEGIFVFDGNSPAVDVAIGDLVRVEGLVSEFFDLTEITSFTGVSILSSGNTLPSAAAVTLPVTSVSDWESVEGMRININQTLYASGNFTQARFGEVDLSVGAPLDNPTNVVAPGAPAIALQDLNNRSRIQLDDGSTVQNPLPLPPYLGPGNTLRTGDTIPGITGVVSFSFGNYEIHPTQPVNFTRVNVRPGVPNVGGTIQVAAYNVLNYFTTIDNGSPICGPLGNQGCRGADTASEFTRQRDKLIDAISQLDADVVGLMEIENHPGDVPTADLVAGLNAATVPGKYAYIATGAIGSDAIRVAVLYQPASVTPFGAFEILDSSDDPDFDDTLNRPMLVQSFIENATGAVFTVGVNHLKSKGSDCNAVGDPDVGDGQGNCNITRTKAAQAIVDFLATDPTGSGDSDFLVIGDLNAYAQEDPVVTLENGGYTDLIEMFVGSGWSAGAYSFNFFSQSGYLDHGMSSPTMTPQVTGAAFWHVNADEPSGLDYNNFNQPLLYNPDEFRSSDHDPVVIGLALNTVQGLKESARGELALLLPTGNTNDDQFIRKAIDRINASLTPAWWTSPSTLDPGTGGRVFDREHQAVQELMKVTTVNVLPLIDRILDADRQLALQRLTAAINGGGNPSRIAQAQANLADAAASRAAGNFAKAVLDYKNAWTNAVKALP